METVSKLKALLVRTKKELAEGRRKEVELGEQVDKLTAELESGRGQFEEHKVVLENIIMYMYLMFRTVYSPIVHYNVLCLCSSFKPAVVWYSHSYSLCFRLS